MGFGAKPLLVAAASRAIKLVGFSFIPDSSLSFKTLDACTGAAARLPGSPRKRARSLAVHSARGSPAAGVDSARRRSPHEFMASRARVSCPPRMPAPVTVLPRKSTVPQVCQTRGFHQHTQRSTVDGPAAGLEQEVGREVRDVDGLELEEGEEGGRAHARRVP